MTISPLEIRYRTEMSDVFSEENRLRKWIAVEVALAKAHADVGNIPKEAAEAIEKASSQVNIERVLEIEKEIHHDLMAVVRALAEKSGEYGGYIHYGATSYDIEDSGTALLFKEGISILEKHILENIEILKNLALEHKETVCIGRTHGQHAIPTTFGMKFALYYSELKRHLERLNELKKRAIVGKMSGAVGTMAGFGEKAFEIESKSMEYLGISPAIISNQVVQRDRHAELFSFISLVGGTIEKISKEIRNLSRPETNEVRESFGKKQVGSSTMPHKRNPHKSERLCSLARVLRSNVSMSMENIALEHERDLTNSANERFLFPESFIVLDFMLVECKKILENLEFYPENIKKNLELTNGLIMAERIMLFLVAKGKGRQEAHEKIRELSQKAFTEKKHLKEVIKESELSSLFSEEELDELFDYSTYIGKAKEIIERTLE
ncbi:adenylosuccinate lyase [Candidatus Micrarchaeota archaeon]|nr:adenylosuccinate lyase [Candidatus Micrarchaeota archaeon]